MSFPMTQPIACPMEPSPSFSSSYSSYSSNSSYSTSSPDSISFLDAYYLGPGTGTGPSSVTSGSSTGPGSVSDFPLHQGGHTFEPSSFDSSINGGPVYDFNPTFLYTPDALPLMDAPTSYPASSCSSMTPAPRSNWSPTSMPPVEQPSSMFCPIDSLAPESAIKPAKPYPCDDCGKAFTRPADLKRHQSTVHYPVFQNCPVPDCSRKDSNGFPRRDHLVEHLRSYHHMNVPKRRAAKRVRVH